MSEKDGARFCTCNRRPHAGWCEMVLIPAQEPNPHLPTPPAPQDEAGRKESNYACICGKYEDHTRGPFLPLTCQAPPPDDAEEAARAITRQLATCYCAPGHVCQGCAYVRAILRDFRERGVEANDRRWEESMRYLAGSTRAAEVAALKEAERRMEKAVEGAKTAVEVAARVALVLSDLIAERQPK